VLVCILDGWGVNVEDEYNAVFSAETPCTDALKAVPKRYRSVKAHGTAVGLPSDADMGNSEVGHNALGSGQVRAATLGTCCSPTLETAVCRCRELSQQQ
jgi:2,3-bisphosphoglycerate-independent phosphoglycerate mutase